MLEVRKLVCGYGKLRVTGEINLKFEGVTLLYGPNGVGKSTFLKTLAGILKPIGGEVLIDGESITENRGILFYLTERIDVPEYVAVKDYVRVFCALYGVQRNALSRLEEALEIFGGLINARLSNLSQGREGSYSSQFPTSCDGR